MRTILTWRERCEAHSDHQSGVVTSRMIAQRMQEEIDELREFHDKMRKWVELLPYTIV